MRVSPPCTPADCERDAVEDVPLADLEALEPERGERLQQQHAARDDRRRAIGMESRHGAPLVVRHRGEAGQDLRRRRARDDVAVDARGVVRLELQLDRGDRGRGAGDRDHARRGVAQLRRARLAAKISRTSARERLELGRRRRVVWMWRSLWRTTPACVETWKRMLGAARRRSARSTRRRCRRRRAGSSPARARRRAEVRQPRLLLAGDRPRVETVDVDDALRELGAVGGVAHRAREDGRHRLGAARRVDRRAVLVERREDARHRIVGEAAARSTPAPRRVTVLRRSISSTLPATGSASAISSRVEFVPMSTTATRNGLSGEVRLARVDDRRGPAGR